MDRMKNYSQYIRPRQQRGQHPNNLFFLTHGAKQLTNMAARVEVQAKRFNFTSTDVRKAVSTEATKNLKPNQIGMISKQLNHSPHVEARFYNKDLHTTKSAVDAYDLIQTAVQQAAGPSSKVAEPVKPVRKYFTSTEQKRVETFFKSKIEKGQTILKSEAIQFVKDNPSIHRDWKQIQDKVRNLAKYI